MQPGGGGDIHDTAGLAVLDAEVGRRGADEFEGLGVVERDDGVPLLVCGLEERESASEG